MIKSSEVIQWIINAIQHGVEDPIRLTDEDGKAITIELLQKAVKELKEYEAQQNK